MPKAVFVSHAGLRTEIDVAVGVNLMKAAVDKGIEGIVGDCGGVLACATCHVFVDPSFAPLCGSATGNEDDMLNYTAAARAANSRLCCQIVMKDELDGIVVTIADPQL